MTDNTCPICDESFMSEKAIRDHTWDSHGACHHCGDTFDNRKSLYSHWLENHGSDLSEKSRKRAENKVGDRTVCPICEERFGSQKSVRDHAWDLHGACHYCGDNFGEEEALYVHWLAAHENNLNKRDKRDAKSEIDGLTFRDRLSHQGPLGAVKNTNVSRRTLLQGGAASVLLLLVGGGAFALLGGDGNEGGDGGSIGGHPATEGLENQPTLGPSPSESEATIVAFEDPSCPSCARFELDVFPRLKKRLVDTGQVSFVYRGIPVVRPWGESAILALESTYARNQDAFWSLKNFYYQSQNRIGGGNVLDMTRGFLNENTGVDASAVLNDVNKEKYQGSVNQDIQASKSAGVRGTPTFFLFKNGSYLTNIVGPQSYNAFKSALNL